MTTSDRRGDALKMVAATALFALVHSALASRRTKDAVRRAVGDRAYDGWYRVFFNAQAVVGSVALAAYLAQLDGRPLYEVRGPLRALMRAGQLAGAALAVQAVREVGLARLSGTASVAAWSRGDALPPEPEGQGPNRDESGRLRVGPAFALARHPLNLAPLPMLWLNPRMTATLAAFNAAATVYFVAGSWHEETRLAAAYGDEYEAYRRSGTPFYLPGRASVARTAPE